MYSPGNKKVSSEFTVIRKNKTINFIILFPCKFKAIVQKQCTFKFCVKFTYNLPVKYKFKIYKLMNEVITQECSFRSHNQSLHSWLTLPLHHYLIHSLAYISYFPKYEIIINFGKTITTTYYNFDFINLHTPLIHIMYINLETFVYWITD